jgi:hypothetical protein
MGPGRRVRITVRGRLSERFATAFEGMRLVRRGGCTELVGEIADQAQLHGLLTRIRDLGLELEQVSLAEETAGRPGPERWTDEEA